MTRLIDADKLHPDCFTKDGKLAISQSQIADAPVVEICTSVIEDRAYCRGLEDSKKIARPQGEWIYDSDHSITIDMYKCSVCDGYGHTHFNFCPNCGAAMRKGEKTNEL